jgi:predicted acyl esterase
MTDDARHFRRALSWASLLLVGSLAGCLGAVDGYYEFDPDPQYRNPGVFLGNYSISSQSLVLTPGPHKPGLPEIVQLRSNRPAYAEQTNGLTTEGEVLITMAIWRPDNVSTPVPVIVDAGPYYEVGQHCIFDTSPCPEGMLKDDTIDYPGQTTPFSLKNFLPHGYAVVQLAVRGTGTHGGCMDLMGDDEVHDLDQAITWLGQQPWSNGRVAMWGASYDGSTPWEVASKGNKYLKTIVPVSGLPDIFDLMFRNGSAETRGAIMHSLVYGPYGYSDDFPQQIPNPSSTPLPVTPPVPLPSKPAIGQANGREPYQDMQNLICEDALKGAAQGPAAVATGNRLSEADNYWVERDHRQAVLDNYEGSVFLIHGLQDWNVDPHAAIPFNAQLRAKGLEMKEWYGQWGHAFPDSSCTVGAIPVWVTLPCRLDFAEVLLRWFERHLKENMTVDVGPSIQVQNNAGIWRNADSYPPTSAAWTPFHLTADGNLASKPSGNPTPVRLMPPTNGAPAKIVEVVSAPTERDMHISGMPTLQLPFQAYGQGGQIGVWMFDQDPNGKVHAPGYCPPQTPFPPPCDPFDWRAAGTPVVGHAQMNLLYYAGGETRQTLRPDQTYVAQIQFEPLEILIPKGHRIVLWIFQYQYNDRQATMTPAPVDIYLGGSGAVLQLPFIDVDAKTVFPVPGSHFPTRELMGHRYVAKPIFPPSGPVIPLAVPAATMPASPTPTVQSCPQGVSAGTLNLQATCSR